MKKFLSLSLTLLVLIMSCFMIVSCVDKDGGGQGDMLYTEDTSLGTGSTTFTLIVEHVNDKKVTFTINTNKTILSDALVELELCGWYNDRELGASRKVLRAAAMTYIAALAMSVIQLLRLLSLLNNSRRD